MTTYYPISYTVPQYINASTNAPYSGAVLKAYSAGTSTPISMATDYTGNTTATDAILNASGYPTVSGNVIIPHLSENYKLALYPTQAAADANSGAIWSIDNVQVAQNANAARYLNYAADEGAADAYVVNPDPAVSAYSTGDVVTLKPANANTGASTIALNGLATKDIKLWDGSALYAGALLTTGIYQLQYNGTYFVLMNPSFLSGATLTGATLVTPTITVNDNVFIMRDNSDITKRVLFEASGISAGTDRTVTFPDASGTLMLTSTAISSGQKYTNAARLTYSVTSGTNGPTYSATTWNTVAFNTEEADPGSIVTLSANRFTPIAGVYMVFGSVVAKDITKYQRLRIYNITGASVAVAGVNYLDWNTVVGYGAQHIMGVISANGTDAYEVQLYSEAASDAPAANSIASVNEVWNALTLVKLT